LLSEAARGFLTRLGAKSINLPWLAITGFTGAAGGVLAGFGEAGLAVGLAAAFPVGRRIAKSRRLTVFLATPFNLERG